MGRTPVRSQVFERRLPPGPVAILDTDGDGRRCLGPASLDGGVNKRTFCLGWILDYMFRYGLSRGEDRFFWFGWAGFEGWEPVSSGSWDYADQNQRDYRGLLRNIHCGSSILLSTVGFEPQRSYVHDSPELIEYVRKPVEVFSPINHSAGHGGSLSLIFSFNQKPEPGVVEKAYRSGLAPYILFPMARICRNWDQGDDFCAVCPVCKSTST